MPHGISNRTSAQRLAQLRDRRLREVLRSIASLCVVHCKECSATEIAILLNEQGITTPARGVASRLGALRKRGFVTSRVYMQRHLWRLTQAGKSFLETHPNLRMKMK